ncbi:hypothetical protein [Hyphomicrobium sp.]|uniref:hypothetical protein n=1 Tax=Hyphomicrobium sp. TaxID=82 RepID=UPI000F9DF449|nr:hypothetical protein [Hyphomicrobium sp.]RUP08364.1 MAG: hypothetical protein EKK38_14100 [Hyphomicrobium sp.]
MKRLVVMASAVFAMSLPAFADAPLTPDEMQRATAAASAMGCEGGKWEKETEGTGVFELDDAKCKGGSYDLKFDKDFKLLNMSAD